MLTPELEEFVSSRMLKRVRKKFSTNLFVTSKTPILISDFQVQLWNFNWREKTDLYFIKEETFPWKCFRNIFFITYLGNAGMKWWCQSFKAAMLVSVNNAWWVSFSSKCSSASSSIWASSRGTICWKRKIKKKRYSLFYIFRDSKYDV